MSRILTVNTSSSRCSVGMTDADLQMFSHSNEAGSHGKNLPVLINELLQRSGYTFSDIEAFAVVAGPGSFTGLRIGIGVVQGLAFAMDKPVVLLSTLELLAMSAIRKHGWSDILVAIKARENEVYFSGYTTGTENLPQLKGKEQVCSPDTVQLPENAFNVAQLNGIGSGWQYRESLCRALSQQLATIDPDDTIDDYCIYQLSHRRFHDGLVVDADAVLPNYVKEKLDYGKS